MLPALEVLFELRVAARGSRSRRPASTPAFPRFAALSKRPNLAVSLNAADTATRERLMPITKTYPLKELLAAIRAWPLESRRTILIEYVLIAGVNDSEADARKLARLLRGLSVKINLIPLNEDPTYLPDLRRPDEAAIDQFARVIAAERLGDGAAQQGPRRFRGVRPVEGKDGGPEEEISAGRKPEAGKRVRLVLPTAGVACRPASGRQEIREELFPLADVGLLRGRGRLVGVVAMTRSTSLNARVASAE